MASRPAAPGAPQGATPDPQTWTVSQLAARIGHALSAGVPDRIRVVGEVSGFRDRTHWYFDLKDADAVVSCVVFQTAAKKARFTPASGQQVVASGRIDFYAKQGKVTLLIDKLEPVGAGALELAFRKLCEELRALGYFEQARKRPLPAMPRRIAVVTSRTGAALQDVLDTLRRRGAAPEVILVDVRVQGEGAALEVARAIGWLGGSRPDLDAILVTRGGGSAEDLWAFNERPVADAIFRSPIPVVAAIGHETDTTIAELVADLRCATPTQAAMRLSPDRTALLQQVDALGGRLRSVVVRHCREGASRLSALARRPAIADPRSLLAGAAQRLVADARHLRLATSGAAAARHRELDALASRLEAVRPARVMALRNERLAVLAARLRSAGAGVARREDLDSPARALGDAVGRLVRARRERVEALARHLLSVGPQSVLNRGFSFTQTEDGRLVRSVWDVTPGLTLRTRVSDGEVRSLVEGSAAPKPGAPMADKPVDADGPAPKASQSLPGAGASRKPRAKPDGPDQLDLFLGGR